MGAMGKSAQFLLHTWLPDAMEGPTPVSALIHAATMVTAGVFMVARCRRCSNTRADARRPSSPSSAPPRRSSPRRSAWCRTTSSASSPIRPVRSSATCSSRRGRGLSGGMFHLFTHAFFKALLFLGAGSVIHAMHHEQDMRKMGGLWRKIPSPSR
jgi:NADH-quinone oxidoreductase subunit L